MAVLNLPENFSESVTFTLNTVTVTVNTERCSLSLRIQPKYEKIRTTKTPNIDTFYAVLLFKLFKVNTKL